jgi:hypothetical protein
VLAGEQLTAGSLHNTATFLECLIVADEIIMAPTVAWAPDSSDDALFANTGICHQFRSDSLNDLSWREVFIRAAQASLTDTSDLKARDLLGIEEDSIKDTRDIIESWLPAMGTDPMGFMKTYSEPVMLTDVATQRYMHTFDTNMSMRTKFSRHAAQYLLRTNVALQLSMELPDITFPYHPHSHRSAFVAQKIAKASARPRTNLSSVLIGEAETTIQRIVEEFGQTALLASIGAFRTHERELPLVLAVVLSGSASKDEVLPRALELRDSRAAQEYRRWIGTMISAARSRNFHLQLTAERELRIARTRLKSDLEYLYGMHEETAIGRTTTLVGTGTQVDSTTSGTAFLVSLVHQSLALPAVRGLVARVFPPGLTDTQWSDYHALRRSRRDLGL